jgi:predicted ATPase
LAPLPVPLTHILGREREAGAACALLLRSEVQLLTLTAVAGVGKTRLALAIVTKLRKDCVEGVYFVSLAAIRDPDRVLPAIAEALGLPGRRTRSPLERLQGALRERQALLVLDNFEQMVMAAPLLVELLAACSSLTVLVTSQEVLHVRGEREFRVLPLALPDSTHLPDPQKLAGYGAIALFLEPARGSQPTVQPTDEIVPLIVAICRRLDGLTLTIELAAARLKLLSLPALLERLEHRLTALTGGPRDLPVRQRTIRATIAWSYDLVSEEEQRLFRLLSVFVGGASLEAMEGICRALDRSSPPHASGLQPQSCGGLAMA